MRAAQNAPTRIERCEFCRRSVMDCEAYPCAPSVVAELLGACVQLVTAAPCGPACPCEGAPIAS
jgi:hypothetical protein